MPPLKQDSVDNICVAVGLPPMEVGHPGSSVPVELFYGVARAFGVEVGGGMPQMGEAMAKAAGLPWETDADLPGEQRCDSRKTPSGGGSTVTAHGMERILEAVKILQTKAPPLAQPGRTGQGYIEAHGGVEGDEVLVAHDLTLLDKATKAHAETQNALASFVRSAGLDPLSPRPGEPLFDIAWQSATGLVVCEVKTITAHNARQQTRLAIGQLAEYRWKLRHVGVAKVVLATDADLPQAQQDLCAWLDITTTAPPTFAVDLAHLLAPPATT